MHNFNPLRPRDLRPVGRFASFVRTSWAAFLVIAACAWRWRHVPQPLYWLLRRRRRHTTPRQP